jgi:hypothetical protein
MNRLRCEHSVSHVELSFKNWQRLPIRTPPQALQIFKREGRRDKTVSPEEIGCHFASTFLPL